MDVLVTQINFKPSLYQAYTKPEMSSNIQNSMKDAEIPYHGKFISYHDNGNIKEEGTYVQGMLQGVFREYDEDGKLRIQSHWKDHKLNGKFTHWRDINTGALYETTMYKDDIKVYSSTFDKESRISGNYYYDSNGKGVSCVQYKRLPSGYTVVTTTTMLPTGSISYKEELVI